MKKFFMLAIIGPAKLQEKKWQLWKYLFKKQRFLVEPSRPSGNWFSHYPEKIQKQLDKNKSGIISAFNSLLHGQDILAILVTIMDITHLAEGEHDAKPADGASFPRQRGVGIFVLQGVERHAAVLEAEDDAVAFLNIYIQVAIRAFGIGVFHDIRDNFLADQTELQSLM